MRAGFKRQVRTANILTAIFQNELTFTKAKRFLEPTEILTSNLFINSQKNDMHEIGCAILKAKVSFSVFSAK